MPFLRRADDEVLLSLYEESGRNAQRATMLLRDVLRDYPERAELANDLVICENEGDRITHDIIHRLGSGKVRAPFDFAGGYALAAALDDVVDYAEQTADTLGVYHVEAPMEQADRMCDVLVGAGEQVANALRGMRTGSDLGPTGEDSLGAVAVDAGALFFLPHPTTTGTAAEATLLFAA